MNKTKIEWCDCTVNPVVGCPRLCGAEFDADGNMIKEPWCYAYKINKRFHIVKDFCKPEFFPERLKALYSKKPKVIFLNSMSDVEFWGDNVWLALIKAITKNPQHKYIFLTKDCRAYDSIVRLTWNKAEYGLSCDESLALLHTIRGLTVTKEKNWENWDGTDIIDFVSLEPLLEKVILPNYTNLITQIIIGAETGNRKSKVIPKKEWIDSLVAQADAAGIKVFMKDSLIPIVGEENMRRDLIWR